MSRAIPRLVLPNLRITPTKLLTVMHQLRQRYGQGASLRPDGGNDADAEAYITAMLRGSVVGIPDDKLARALCRIYGIQKEPRRRQAIEQAVLAAPRVGWRHLWSLWEQTDTARGKISQALAARLARRAVSSSSFAERRLPAWLPLAHEPMAMALENPGPSIRKWCETNRVPLDRLHEGLGCSTAFGPGHDAVVALVSDGADSWWRLNGPQVVRTWAETRSLEVLQAVADRQLRDLGAKAKGPGDLLKSNEAGSLKRWLLAQLGEPAARPGAWARISADSRKIFEWMLLAEELSRILEEFRRGAEDDRARFWTLYLPYLRDARYITSYEGIAVCLMVIGTVLAIEFGTTGNACYFYKVPVESPSLRSRHFSNRLKAADFKSLSALGVGKQSLAFIKKMNHSYGWQANFDVFLKAAIKQESNR